MRQQYAIVACALTLHGSISLPRFRQQDLQTSSPTTQKRYQGQLGEAGMHPVNDRPFFFRNTVRNESTLADAHSLFFFCLLSVLAPCSVVDLFCSRLPAAFYHPDLPPLVC